MCDDRSRLSSGDSVGDSTVAFSSPRDRDQLVLRCLSDVFSALSERGYDPVNQLVGYLMSGDPVYVTSHRDARSKILSFSREEILYCLVRYCLG